MILVLYPSLVRGMLTRSGCKLLMPTLGHMLLKNYHSNASMLLKLITWVTHLVQTCTFGFFWTTRFNSWGTILWLCSSLAMKQQLLFLPGLFSYLLKYVSIHQLLCGAISILCCVGMSLTCLCCLKFTCLKLSFELLTLVFWMQNPSKMRKAQVEIDSVLGQKRPTFESLKKLE